VSDFLVAACTLPGIKLAAQDTDGVVCDNGVVTSTTQNKDFASDFLKAIGNHRFWSRDTSKVAAS